MSPALQSGACLFISYEGYAPGGVAVIIEALTDNLDRTADEVRSYLPRRAGPRRNRIDIRF